MILDYTKAAKLHRAIDGDTFVLNVDLHFNVWAHITVRLRGVNAPEKGAPGGTAATDYLRSLLTDRTVYMISYKDRMTFTRWVADVKVAVPVQGEPDDLIDVAEAMLEAGHAVRYP